MDRRTLLTAVLGSAGIGLVPSAVARRALRQDLAGEWGGALELGPRNLRLRLVLSEVEPGAQPGAQPGAWSASLYSLDQGNVEIPASHVQLDGEHLVVRFESIAAELDVVLLSGERLVGIWEQGGNRLPFVLQRDPDWDALTFQPTALDDELLAKLRAESGVPALAASVLASGVDPFQRRWAVGQRSQNEPTPVQLDDRWHLGSITKSMTATLVARLVEAGHFEWQTTVGELLGEQVPDMQPSYRDATFLHLLSHHAGLQANLPGLAMLVYPRVLPEAGDPRDSRTPYAVAALRQKPHAALGESFLYANNGYIVAGAMIESVLDQPWEAAIREQLFEPLGLTSAGFGPPGRRAGEYGLSREDTAEPSADSTLSQPVGHAPNPLRGLGADKPLAIHPDGAQSDNPIALGPAGRVHMGLADLSTYLAAHRDRSPLLEPESWERLHTPPFGGQYALGWIVREDGALSHNGTNLMWYAEVLVDRERGVVAAAAANAGPSLAVPAVPRALASAAEAGLA